MREPPEMELPMPGDLMPDATRILYRSINEAMAWIKEATEEIGAAGQQGGLEKAARDGAKMLLQLESLADTPVVLRFDAERCEWRCEYGEYMHGAAYTPHEAVDALWNILARRKLEAV